jgi:hypothetical protein
VLEKMMAEETWSETEANTLHIEDFEPETVELMLQFMYTNQRQNVSTDLLLIADKYNIPELFRYLPMAHRQFAECDLWDFFAENTKM